MRAPRSLAFAASWRWSSNAACTRPSGLILVASFTHLSSPLAYPILSACPRLAQSLTLRLAPPGGT
eukprot:1717980-Pleurochrysis_carterae.AAC.1